MSKYAYYKHKDNNQLFIRHNGHFYNAHKQEVVPQGLDIFNYEEITEQQYMGLYKSNTKPEPNLIDLKIAMLLALSDEFIFPAYFPHTDEMMWKISNVYTHASNETFVLCPVTDSIGHALDLAIERITKAKKEFYGE